MQLGFSFLRYRILRHNIIKGIQVAIPLLLGLLCYSMAKGQNVGINEDGSTPNPHAILDIEATNNDKGMLIPRITTAQREAIAGLASTEKGLTVYDETTASYWLWNGTQWIEFVMNTPKTQLECLSVKAFGAKGDGATDDLTSIQAAIDSATQVGAKICFPAGIYILSGTLNLKAGVTLAGSGRGSTSTLTPYNGTVLKYTGTGLAISIEGQNASLRDLTVYDDNSTGAAGGIAIIADGTAIESVIIENVLLFGFTSGYALKFEAINSGGIAYCSCSQLRIRHAKTGILITQDGTSFVNSNSFYHGAISGGGFDYCLRVLGGNNNVFNSMIMEPYTSTFGHIVVEAGEIIGNRIRIEGTSQPSSVPLIEFKTNTANSILNGTYSGGLTLDRGDNFIDFHTGKAIDFKNTGVNLFENSGLWGVASNTVPYWEVSGVGITITSQPAELLDNHKVIEITVPAGISGYIRPDVAYVPDVMTSYKFDQVNFGAYIKTDVADAVLTSCKAPAGTASSTAHPGDNEWHFTGMTSWVSRSQPYDPKFLLDNSSGASSLVVYFTTPTLSFGTSSPQLEAKTVNSTGGIMAGTLSTNMQSTTVPGTTFLTLEKNGNVFEITGTQTLARINHLTADRFAKGTIITLLFNDAGASVVNGAYIALIAAYTSTVNSSLTLVSNGDGTWREINRNL